MVVKKPDEKTISRAIRKNIECGKILTDTDNYELAAAARINISTLFRRYKSPMEFTVRELSLISMKLKIPIEEILKSKEDRQS